MCMITSFVLFFTHTEEFIQVLDEDYHLLDVFLTSFTKFHDKCKEVAASGAADIAAIVSETQARLQFLLYVSVHSALFVDFKYISSLWACCVPDRSIPEQSAVLLKWLWEACDYHAGSKSVFAQGTVHALFTQLMMKVCWMIIVTMNSVLILCVLFGDIGSYICIYTRRFPMFPCFFLSRK